FVSLTVEHEQIQKRTFTNWINAQLAKRCPPSFVSDLFSDLRHGSQLLDLLEVMSGQPMLNRFQIPLRADIETALSFLKKKSIKLVNINIPDIIDGRSSIILGLVWTIILHCHIEELASTLSFSSRHSSFDSLTSLDSWSGSPVPSSPVPLGQTPPLHRHFRISAKKALCFFLTFYFNVLNTDFKSSWRSGEAFLVVLCSLRPQLVDLSLVQSRSNQENLEEAFHLAERELHIPRLLEPQDVDVKDPDEKSIMTYVAQFLQYSNDMPAPDDHLQVCNQTLICNHCFILLVKHNRDLFFRITHSIEFFLCCFTGNLSLPDQVLCLCQVVYVCLQLQRCKTELDLSLPPPLDIVAVWLQRAEAALAEDGGRGKDHADAAKEARAQHDTLKVIFISKLQDKFDLSCSKQYTSSEALKQPFI
uniref:Calponin-homology (CH) domain-containing protein n=1 Tax=Monopterus albus TaxID=43700 RepID=A0A3Q3K9S0_MONAL